MEYLITIDGFKTFRSTSRDSKKHLREYGGNNCTVMNPQGKLVSMAKRDCNNKIYNCYLG